MYIVLNKYYPEIIWKFDNKCIYLHSIKDYNAYSNINS